MKQTSILGHYYSSNSVYRTAVLTLFGINAEGVHQIQPKVGVHDNLGFLFF